MGAVSINTSPIVQIGLQPAELSSIRLHYGEALWIMARLGFQGNASKSTFYEYVKSLRELGSPFERGKIGFGRRGRVNYSYCHLMELALVLTLRVYHVFSTQFSPRLSRIGGFSTVANRRAYAHRSSGTGAPVAISALGRAPITTRGVFLDLQLDFSGGVLTRFGRPILLSPYQAPSTFADRDLAARALLPINLSPLAERLVSAALNAPTIRRGPGPVNREHRPQLPARIKLSGRNPGRQVHTEERRPKS